MSDHTNTNRALIAAFERARGMRTTRDVSQLFSMALMGVFFLSLMGGLVVGASLYRFTAEAQHRATDLHLQSGLLANVIHAGDVAGAVSEGEGPEGRALVLSRQLASGTYETRIYLYEGSVVQELSAAARPYDPLGATELLESSTFDFTLQDRLLTITTDAGSFDVALRCDAEAPEATPGRTTSGGGAPEVQTILDDGGM